MKKTKKIGIELKNVPSKECVDSLCPFHGSVKVRGRVFVGTVTSDKMRKTVSVEWNRTQFIQKYQRYEKKKSRVKAHNPECLDAKKGDIVKIAETRPLSKTKNFVVIEIVGKEKVVKSEEEVLEESEKIRGKKKVSEKNEEPKEDKE